MVRNFEMMTAMAPQRRVWVDRVRIVEMPLFPGYIFARFPEAQRVEVEKTPGVASVVRFGDQCCPVDDREIEAIRIVLDSGRAVHRAPYLSVGKQVIVQHGPLAGACGYLADVENRFHLIVSVRLLQRSVGVEIDEAEVEPLWSPNSSVQRSLIEAM